MCHINLLFVRYISFHTKILMKHPVLIIAGCIVFLSCGVVQRSAKVQTPGVKKAPAASPAPVFTPVSVPAGYEARRKKLDEAYGDWRGIPYVLGGTSYSGVDCSSFMQIVFEDYFGIKLPRSTREQMSAGSLVKKGNIRVGDLIFFNTARRTLHVGVALNETDFLHASTTAGVTVSSLNDSYWSKSYLTTRRVMQ